MAAIADNVNAVDGCCEAWCLSEKRARKRWARGADSEVRVLRSGRMVFSKDSSGINEEPVGEVADGAILKTPEWSGWLSGKLE